MVVRTEKTCPSASYLLGHEVWTLWLPLMLPQTYLASVGQSIFSSYLYPQPCSNRVLFDLVAVLCCCQHQESRLCSSHPINCSHRCLGTRLNSSLLVSTCALRFSVVSLLRIPPSIQLSSTYPARHRSMAITL